MKFIVDLIYITQRTSSFLYIEEEGIYGSLTKILSNFKQELEANLLILKTKLLFKGNVKGADFICLYALFPFLNKLIF